MTVAVLAAIMLPAKADEIGVSEDAILFGQAAALEGPSSTLGQRMRQGSVPHMFVHLYCSSPSCISG